MGAKWPKVIGLTAAMIQRWFSASRALGLGHHVNIDNHIVRYKEEDRGVRECSGSSEKGAVSPSAIVSARWLLKVASR